MAALRGVVGDQIEVCFQDPIDWNLLLTAIQGGAFKTTDPANERSSVIVTTSTCCVGRLAIKNTGES